MDKDRHLIDCLSYMLLDDPRFIDQAGGLSMGAGAEPATLCGKVIATCLNGGETGSVCTSTVLVR